jgi:TusA-related sulfurtransferase
MGGGETKEKKVKLEDGQLLLIVTDKRQTRPLVREGAQQRQHSKIQTEWTSGRKSQGRLDAKTCWLTDRQS